MIGHYYYFFEENFIIESLQEEMSLMMSHHHPKNQELSRKITQVRKKKLYIKNVQSMDFIFDL